MKAAIIGSGVSGLTAAAILAKEGHAVTVFEQYKDVGGVTATIEQDGFRWDLGPMLLPDLGPGEPGRAILQKLGISDKVPVIKSYRENYFPDFRITRPARCAGPYGRKAFFKKTFPEDAAGIDRYFEFYDRIHDMAALYGKGDLWSKVRLFAKLLPVMRMKNWSADKMMDHFFTNDKLKTVFTAILADYVMPPARFPGMILPLINAEQQYDERTPLDYPGHEHRSSWSFIENGCQSLVDALSGSIRAHGGKILTKAPVKKIEIKNGRVTGVVYGAGQKEPVDLVIASGGARELFFNLVGRENLPERFVKKYLDNIAVTESVLMVHLGVDIDPAKFQNGAPVCYYYMSYDIDHGIRECMDNIYHEGREGFLLYNLSTHSPTMAPPGHHALTVLTIAPNNPVNGSWKENKEAWADQLVGYAEEFIPDLKRHIKTRVVLTPEDFRKRTGLDHHAFGGCTPAVDSSPPKRETPIEGLWFVGAQSETYGGVTNAMIGAAGATGRIMRK
jgi:phytoene dehydrogenase-like protein